MREKWLPVVGWEGWYEVSSKGRVRRSRGGQGAVAGRILKPQKLNEYRSVQIQGIGKPRRFYIHCLVMAAFVGPPPEGNEVNHCDFNKTNNRRSNLEYVTPEENRRHARERLIRGERHHTTHLVNADIRQIRDRYAAKESQKSIASYYGVNQPAISSIVRRRTWKHVR